MVEKVTASSVKDICANIWAAPLLKSIGAVCMLIFTSTFGAGDHKEIRIVFTLLLFDTITGFLKAARKGDLSSPRFFRVAVKAMVYYIFLSTFALFDSLINTSWGVPIMSGFLTITEAISIMENAAEMGIPVPRVLVQMLKVVQHDDYEPAKQHHSKHRKKP